MALCMLVSTVTTSMMFSGVFILYPACSQERSEVRILMRCGKISACVLPGSGRTNIRIYACVWTHLRSFQRHNPFVSGVPRGSLLTSG